MFVFFLSFFYSEKSFSNRNIHLNCTSVHAYTLHTHSHTRTPKFVHYSQSGIIYVTQQQQSAHQTNGLSNEPQTIRMFSKRQQKTNYYLRTMKIGEFSLVVCYCCCLIDYLVTYFNFHLEIFVFGLKRIHTYITAVGWHMTHYLKWKQSIYLKEEICCYMVQIDRIALHNLQEFSRIIFDKIFFVDGECVRNMF